MEEFHALKREISELRKQSALWEKNLLDFSKGLINGTQASPQVRLWIIGQLKFHCPLVRDEGNLPLTKAKWDYPTYAEKFQFKERRRAKKLDGLRPVLMSFVDEIMPVKSGSDYRLQFLCDKDLGAQIRQFLDEEYGVKVSNSVILNFLKQNIKRSRVSKPDGCHYCHSLQYCPETLTPDQKN